MTTYFNGYAFSDLFVMWAVRPETLISVWLPLMTALSLTFSALLRKELSFRGFAVWFVLALITGRYLSWWEEGMGLHIYPLLGFVLLAVRRRYAPSFRVVYIVSFGTEIVADILGAGFYAVKAGRNPLDVLMGVGGAGYMDGLLIIPLGITACAVLLDKGWAEYARRLQSKGRKNPIALAARVA